MIAMSCTKPLKCRAGPYTPALWQTCDLLLLGCSFFHAVAMLLWHVRQARRPSLVGLPVSFGLFVGFFCGTCVGASKRPENQEAQRSQEDCGTGTLLSAQSHFLSTPARFSAAPATGDRPGTRRHRRDRDIESTDLSAASGSPRSVICPGSPCGRQG